MFTSYGMDGRDEEDLDIYNVFVNGQFKMVVGSIPGLFLSTC